MCGRRSRYSLRLASRSSTTDSMISPHEASRAGTRHGHQAVDFLRARACLTMLGEPVRPQSVPAAASSAAGCTSQSVTGMPALRLAAAIAVPIRPAPDDADRKHRVRRGRRSACQAVPTDDLLDMKPGGDGGRQVADQTCRPWTRSMPHIARRPARAAAVRPRHWPLTSAPRSGTGH